MPSYNTHYLITKEIGENINNNCHICNNEIKVSNELLNVFSQGQDLTYANPKLFNITHNQDGILFFYILLKYLKDNRLINSPECISFLYGHLVHYGLDRCIHPYIYQLLKENNYKYNHQIIEWQIDEFMARKTGLHTRSINSNYLIDNRNYNYNLEALINSLYNSVYGIDNTVKTYKQSQMMIYLLDKFVKILFNKKGNYHDITSKIINSPYMNMEKVANNSGVLFLNEKEIFYKDLNELMNKTISYCYSLIRSSNQYLYGNDQSMHHFIKEIGRVNYNGKRKCNENRSF